MTSQTSAVVTGAARGIGREIATLLVQRGHRVVLTDIDGEGARRTAEEIGAAEGLAQDVRDHASHTQVAETAARHGVLTAWFNNAGVAHDGTLAALDEEACRRQVEVNLLGVMWGMRAALAALGPRGGDIVNTASLSAHGPVPGLSVYAATKAAVVSLTASASAEAPKGVRVHALCPDGVDTAMVRDMDSDGTGKQLVLSGGRLLTGPEVAAAAVDLLGSRRVIKTLPAWRGAASRASALAPSVAQPAVKLFAAQGRRAQRRTQR